MPVKIRLQRHGKKGKPFYWIVAADARSKRDGRYLEKLGTYNPNTNPATVEVKLDNAVNWLEKGAQPTDTARTLLSYRGVMLKHHLNGGIRKGALSQEEADKKFAAWLEEKEAKIQSKKDGLSQSESELKAKRLADEKAVSDKRLADAAAAEAEAAAEEAAADSTEAEEATTEAAEAPAEQTEAPAEEATTEKEAVAEEAEQEAKETEAAEEPEVSAEQTEAPAEQTEASEEKEE
jgi:small subunit ribosomal protein S16